MSSNTLCQLFFSDLDSMSDLWLYWPGPSQSVVVGVSSALTCMLNNTDPAASFRWFKGQQEITDQAQNPSPTNNSQGKYMVRNQSSHHKRDTFIHIYGYYEYD